MSIGRLWLFDRSAPMEVLWAEDGLFPLCIRKADFFTCTSEPFAGYLLFLPRVLAWPVAVLPWEHWAIAANVIAAILAGLTAAFAFLIVLRAGFGWFTSGVIGLLPVLAPMAGLEAINAIGSSYMLLLFLSTLLIVLPPRAGPAHAFARLPRRRGRAAGCDGPDHPLGSCSAGAAACHVAARAMAVVGRWRLGGGACCGSYRPSGGCVDR